MRASSITSLEMRVVEKVLEMGGGYVLDFSDRTFSEFFAGLGVQIDEARFSVEGTSKAKRLRYYLRNTLAPLSGQALPGILEHRLLFKPDGLVDTDIAAYRKLLERLGGQGTEDLSRDNDTSDEATESDLLRFVFRPDVFSQLPVDPAMISVLVERMEEAQRCIESKAYLAAVILCGSVLEGMCLGYGSQHPERVNRGFGEQYYKSTKLFKDWKLVEWIDVLGRLGDLSPNIEKFGHGLRDFRNYVHPAEQLARRFSPDQHTERIGFQVVVAAAEDLVRAGERLHMEDMA